MHDVLIVSMTRVPVADDADDLVHEVLAFMGQHCESVSLSQLAARFNLHPNTVGNMLKRATGSSFSRLLRSMRVDRAVALLDQGGIPVARVASLCGYDNPASFYRAFREELGVSPRAYGSGARASAPAA